MNEVYIDGVNVAECKNFIPVYTEDEDIEIIDKIKEVLDEK